MSDEFTELDATRPAPGAADQSGPDESADAAPPVLAPPIEDADERPVAAPPIGASAVVPDGRPEAAHASADAVALSDAPQDPVRLVDAADAPGAAEATAAIDAPAAADAAGPLGDGPEDARDGDDVDGEDADGDGDGVTDGVAGPAAPRRRRRGSRGGRNRNRNRRPPGSVGDGADGAGPGFDEADEGEPGDGGGADVIDAADLDEIATTRRLSSLADPEAPAATDDGASDDDGALGRDEPEPVAYKVLPVSAVSGRAPADLDAPTTAGDVAATDAATPPAAGGERPRIGDTRPSAPPPRPSSTASPGADGESDEDERGRRGRRGRRRRRAAGVGDGAAAAGAAARARRARPPPPTTSAPSRSCRRSTRTS